jgi:hypothetical protein
MGELGTWSSSNLCRIMVVNEDMTLDVLVMLKNYSGDSLDIAKLPKCIFHARDKEYQCRYQDDTA